MKEEAPLLEYNEVTIESRGLMIPVKLKLSDQGIAFRNCNEVDVINWQRISGEYGIRIFASNGNLYRFGGFKESDQSKLEKYFKLACEKTMTEKEFSVKGWNYGNAKFEGGVLSFEVSHAPAFEIPINNVSSCVTGKNEVTLEFHQRVMGRASIITATGDALAIFRQVQCLTPRGRYDMKMYPSFIQLHGKTFDFKIPTNTVLRLFLLPHLDGRQHFFVVSLDPPIKQGQTRYPYLILLFANDETDHVELPLTEEELKEKHDGRLEKEISGPMYEVISRIYKGLCNRKIVTPGNFIGHSGTPAISCSYKAAAGYLYPLERGFIYVHKPPVHIRFDEISVINFARSGSTTRSFDFEIECKNGTMNTFSSIEKGEYHKLYDYVTAKKLRIKNRNKMDAVGKKDTFSDSDADEPDHYMNRVRAEAEEREDDDDEESEDSDFNPGEEGSDVAEEYDTNASSSSEDSEGGGSGTEATKKHKEKERKPKKAKTVPEGPRRKKNKKEKDENRPKRPQSAYFLWLNEMRETIKKKNPGISITEISKKAGQMWREVKDKTEWEEKAVEAKARYEEAMKEYKATGSVSGGSKNKNAPKTASPTKGGSGSGFKSKEYIEEESSSSEDSDDKPLKKLKSSKNEKSSKGKKKKASSDEEEEESEMSVDDESD
ncbi:FACT complex subunit Ssrp1 [Armadillidium vulgare]|nr:FACT complex subunit Ssrp1 [Armadillidium vulgare]